MSSSGEFDSVVTDILFLISSEIQAGNCCDKLEHFIWCDTSRELAPTGLDRQGEGESWERSTCATGHRIWG